MSGVNGLPKLAYLYAFKRAILVDILKKGDGAIAEPASMEKLGLSGTFTLKTLFDAVVKMIEAMASLRDFSKEPLTEQEEEDLAAAAQMEQDYEIAKQISALG